ncbi:hypothetical protein HanXRQr2_Chr15g0683011 [Helianthus annuus]|uniref:Uncharacterized protein n=1 Tax=Helianthus annuus TaxID=4232 RepID=A0A251S7M9_HELAN|nr:hypothetical protein HanXRQr2_Chr15g0683011 [Helianthus annuus]KAJ0472291.1 hypothetical protein HanHA89_Chr15g0605381 [Helianthus annuus]KAJ0647889.1 hypothetical protein HanLR1_Chr15g0566711 [Helianthus annuus]
MGGNLFSFILHQSFSRTFLQTTVSLSLSILFPFYFIFHTRSLFTFIFHHFLSHLDFKKILIPILGFFHSSIVDCIYGDFQKTLIPLV